MGETVERVTPGTESWEQYGAEHQQRYEYFKDLYGGRIVLDAACGTGYGTNLIKLSGSTEATGIDISEEALAFARQNYSKPGLHYRHLDCEKISQLNIQPDLVVSFETIEHLHEPEKFMADVAGLLSPGGMFICSTPNKQRLSGDGKVNPYHHSELQWNDFRRLFEKYFIVEKCYHQTETIEYLRYQELKHLLHQQDAKNNAFLFNRIELAARKLFGKKFKPVPFISQALGGLMPADIRIEEMDAPERWHKTFIISGRVKKSR